MTPERKEPVMAEPKSTSKPVVEAGDHDRVVALSVRADGTLDQYDPEIIGDKDAAVAATKRQFAEMAVNAVDERDRATEDEPDTSDAQIDARKAEHEKVAKAAEAKAETVINNLTKR